jgi:hypothetical protein
MGGGAPIPTLMPLAKPKAFMRTLAAVLAVLLIGLATAVPAQGGEMHTGLRAAAIKKCKQKFPAGPRRTVCLKKAKYEPQ